MRFRYLRPVCWNWFEDTLLGSAAMAQFLRPLSFRNSSTDYKNQMNRARSSNQDGISSGAGQALGCVEEFPKRVICRASGDLSRNTRAECPVHSTKV